MIAYEVELRIKELPDVIFCLVHVFSAINRKNMNPDSN